MFGIGVDDLGKLLGGAAGTFIIGILTWIGTRKNRQDAETKPPTASAMGIMLDGDTATALLREAREIHADLQRWRTEDVKNDEIRDLKAQLAQASGVTHGNQAEIVERVEQTDRKIARLLEALSDPNLGEALKGLKVH